MARTRMIKPEFWDDEKLAKVSRDARLLFVGLWSNSDDYGVVKGHPAWLKNRIFPYDEIPLEIFDGWLAELAAIRVIVPFLHNGERYCHIRNFRRHQTINRPSGLGTPRRRKHLKTMGEILEYHRKRVGVNQKRRRKTPRTLKTAAIPKALPQPTH